MDLNQSIITLWTKLSLIQREIAASMIMACVIAAIMLSSWAGKPVMRTLYTGLSLDEAANITDKLTEKGIDFTLSSSGSSILVSQDQVHVARMELAREGLPEKDKGGYKIFESTKISASPLVQEMNHKQAIEEELAKSIEMISGVDYARVLIVLPEQTLFNQTSEKAKASISVKVRPGWTLSQGNIAAITNLTSSSIEGLTPDNVTIIDSEGRLLSRKEDDALTAGANTYQDYKQRVEAGLANKAQEMLEAVLGPGKATVKVSAELDMTTVTTETTEYDKKGVPTKETINSTTKTKNIPTVASNNKTAESSSANETSTEKEEKNETEMLVGKVVTSKVEVPGKVKSLTVAVIVDLNMPQPAFSAAPALSGKKQEEETPAADENQIDKDTQEQSSKQVQIAAPVKIMTVEQVRSIIKNALGKNLLQDEDAISVVDAPFRSPYNFIAEPVAADTMNFEKYADIIRNSSMPIMGLFAFLSVVVFSISGKKKNKHNSKPQMEESDPKPALQAASIENLLPQLRNGIAPEVVYRKHVAECLKQDPEEVKQLFATWVGEDA